MEFVKIDKNFKDVEKFNEIKKDAFPDFDEVTIDNYIELEESGIGHAYAVYDNDKLVGYIIFINQKGNVYFINLAVDKNLRGQGYGSKIFTRVMDYFKEKYDETFFVLDCEHPRKDAKNLSQREARIKLYKRLGFYLTDMVDEYHNDLYVTMTSEEIPNLENHMEFVEYITPLLQKCEVR